MDESFARYLKLLERTERQSLPELAAYQEQLLEALVRHASENVPFYRERLACLSTADGLDLSHWNEVPILEREEAIAVGQALRASRVPDGYGDVVETWTSGSTGNALNIAYNGIVPVITNAAATRMVRWFGLDTSRPLATIRIYTQGEPPRYPDGITRSGWSQAAPAAPSYGLDLRTPVSDQLEWLSRKRAPYLMTLPANAMALAYAVTPEQGRKLGIEFIFTISETVIEGARELVAERFGARLAGIYSCQEIGVIALECPAAAHYHVMAENALVEIVDDEGRDVSPGGFGRIILTGAYNYAMPFIRYAIGDVATAGTEACPCGRTLPVIARVEGRTRMAFVFRDGKRVWPRAWDVRGMKAFVPCRECQIVQIDHERIEFRYVPDGSGAAPDLVGLTSLARKIMHPSVEIIPVAVDVLPRGPGGKFEQVISLVSAGMPPTR
jgi:phenylacetate-CoA ligase